MKMTLVTILMIDSTLITPDICFSLYVDPNRTPQHPQAHRVGELLFPFPNRL